MKIKFLTALTAVFVFASASALAQDPLRGDGVQDGQLDRLDDPDPLRQGQFGPDALPAQQGAPENLSSHSFSATAEIRTETVYVLVPGPTRTVTNTKWRTREREIVPKDVARKADIERLEKEIGVVREELGKRPTDIQLREELAQLGTRLKNEFGVIATKTWQELRAQTPAAAAGKEESNMDIGTILLVALVAAGLVFAFLLFTRPAGNRGGTSTTRPAPAGGPSAAELAEVRSALAIDERACRISGVVSGEANGFRVFQKYSSDPMVVHPHPGVVVVPAGQPPQVVVAAPPPKPKKEAKKEDDKKGGK